MAPKLDHPYPMARNTDPETSHQATRGYNLSERRLQVLQILGDHPGLTAGEISRYFYRRHVRLGIRCAAETPHKRLPELETMDLVLRCAPRRCRDSGKLATTWALTARGLEVTGGQLASICYE